MRHSVVLSALTVLAIGTTAACTEGAGTSGGDASSAAAARGAIKIWLSNNKEELAWGKGMVDAWNSAHPTEMISAEEIPAGKSSEEVIGAAITAGNAPCLIFNTAPAAVPQFQKQGGLVALDDFPDGASYIASRTGKTADQYKSTDGKFYQVPWKSNPVMIFYNKDVFAKAGVDAANPPLKTYAEFLDTSRKVVSSKAAQAAIWPSPTSEFFQPWFDFYPLFIAQSGGKQLVEGNKATFASDAGTKVADFWATIYKEGLAPKEKAAGDAFGTGKAAMAVVGPWAIAAYKDVKWGVVPVPTAEGMGADQIHTFSDAKNVAMYSSCTNRGTAWDVMKFATSKEQDGKLLDATGQMPLRSDLTTAYADYFTKHPEYKQFADMASRTVEVPNVANSITIWQTFRDAYSASVIFAKQDSPTAFKTAADKVAQLTTQP